MASTLTDTIGGFNTYINTLKADNNASYQFSLTLFDTTLEKRYVAVPLKDVPELTTSTYVPGGMTALYDAIGQTVTAVEQSGKQYNKVLTVILTDGHENSSREYRLEGVKTLITRKEKEGNWTFVFLGADLSAFAVGDNIGVRMANSVAYDPANVKAVYANTAHATMFMAVSGQSATTDFYSSVSPDLMKSARMLRRADPGSLGNNPRKR